MASKNSSVSGSAGGSEDSSGSRSKPKISRTRTGCLTCRRRRKKCDEARPACIACVKTNVFCEGYPPLTIWGARTGGKRASRSKPTPRAYVEMPARTAETTSSANLNLFALHNAGTYDDKTPDPNFEMAQWCNAPILSQSSTICSDQCNDNFEDNTVDNEFDILLQQPSQPVSFKEHFVPSTQPVSAFSSQQANTGSLLIGGPRSFETRPSQHFARPSCVPPELPFLISGLESSLHRRLFYHFNHVMSRVLTTSGDDSNPMNSIVTPLALADSTLMQTLLSLAGSHLLNLQPTGTSPEVSAERNRLHQKALHTQTLRVQALKGTITTTGSQIVSQDRDTIFATSLLLCLYDICEGTGGDGWRVHLQMARDLLNISPTATVNPFLLEFFLYHDSLAMVTVPSSVRRINCPTNLSDHNPSLIGVQDGLIEYVTRISSLRSEAGNNSFPPRYDIINKALEIWEDLFRWQPKATLCKDRDLMAQFYRMALFIWLFSIIYPNGKSDPVVQSAVEWMVVEMSEIKSGDGTMACVLFPLFVLGSAAIRQEDRNAVTKHFKRVRAWSSLGNVDLTLEVVKKMWENHDSGLPRSWDWVVQLERHGMSLLVT